MPNTDLQSNDSKLVVNKLDALLQELRESYQSKKIETKEAVVEVFLAALRKFYETLDGPLFSSPRFARAWMPLSREDYNRNWQEIVWDLQIIFKELEVLETTVLKNFNLAATEKEKLLKILRRVSAKVDDYVLYGEHFGSDVVFFKDSFNDVSRIDITSPKLAAKLCEVDTAAGVVTLPVVKDAAAAPKQGKIRINDISNGTAGNFQEVGVAFHDRVDDLLDGNPDTWFEYERVQLTLEENISPLLLDLTVSFDRPEIVNYIRVNPNNFGTQTPIAVEAIDTSLDGTTWISIKDEIPISGFLQEDEEDIFSLAPATNKFAGQGVYVFTPRKAQYIHFKFTQKTPYLIATSTGPRYRYAIGLRDISIMAQKFEAVGDIISTAFESPVELKALTLLASENPTERSELADIKHQISLDDGATWLDIQPQNRSTTDVPEIIRFNTDEETAVVTGSPVYTVRHRMQFNRQTDNFDNKANISSNVPILRSDLLGLPSLSPMVLQLSKTPIQGTVSVVNPLWISRGSYPTRLPKTRYVLGTCGGSNPQKFDLPEAIVYKLRDGSLTLGSDGDLVIWVGDDSTWEKKGNFDASGVDENSKVYIVSTSDAGNLGDPVLQFGNGSESNPKGRIPAGSVISISLSAELASLTSAAPYIVDLAFPTDGDKSRVVIARVNLDDPIEVTGEALRRGARLHRLAYSSRAITESGYFQDFTIASDYNNVLVDPKTFIDGSQELIDAGDYSVDLLNGVLYTYSATPSYGPNCTVSYDYYPRYLLAESDWDWADNSYQRIEIRPQVCSPKVATVSASANVKFVDLIYNNVVQKSLVFDPVEWLGEDVTPYEVAFIDGVTEFSKNDAQIDGQGLYSVDYENGLLYLGPLASTVACDITFKYNAFYIVYDAAYPLGPKDYTIDYATGKIEISESASLRVWGDRKAWMNNKSLLRVTYKYIENKKESLKDLEPYFSPIVRDVVIKALPQDE